MLIAFPKKTKLFSKEVFKIWKLSLFLHSVFASLANGLFIENKRFELKLIGFPMCFTHITFKFNRVCRCSSVGQSS